MKKIALIAVVISIITGCGSNLNIALKPETLNINPRSQLAIVKINDLRQAGVASSTRKSVIGTHIGNITFTPNEKEFLKADLEAELSRILKIKGLISKRRYFVCDLIEFSINSNNNAPHVDVSSTIKLLLKYDQKALPLSATYTKRNYLWPTEEVIITTIKQSLKKIHEQLEQYSTRLITI